MQVNDEASLIDQFVINVFCCFFFMKSHLMNAYLEDRGMRRWLQLPQIKGIKASRMTLFSV